MNSKKRKVGPHVVALLLSRRAALQQISNGLGPSLFKRISAIVLKVELGNRIHCFACKRNSAVKYVQQA